MYEKVHSAVMVDVEFNLLAPCFFIHTYLRYLFSSPAVGLVAGCHDWDCLWLSSILPEKYECGNKIIQRPISATFFPVRYPLIFPPFDAR